MDLTQVGLSGIAGLNNAMLRSVLRNNKNMKKHIRKVTRVGKRSLSITIPAEIVKDLKIRERQKLVIEQKEVRFAPSIKILKQGGKHEQKNS